MAKIKVNDAQWNALSKQDQDAVTQLLRRVGSLQKDDVIVGDAATPAMSSGDGWPDFPDPRKELCKIACEVAGRAAQAACAALPGPAMVACMIAAQAALEECKRRC